MLQVSQNPTVIYPEEVSRKTQEAVKAAARVALGIPCEFLELPEKKMAFRAR